MNRSLWLGGNLKLQCPPSSNLAETSWERDDLPLPSSPRLQRLRDGLFILNATSSDAGRYRCLSKERSHTDEYTTTVADYRLSIATGSGRGVGLPSPPQAQRDGPSVPGLQATVGLLVVLLTALLGWNFYKGHLPLPWKCGKKRGAEGGQNQGASGQGGPSSSVTHQAAPVPVLAESKPLVSGAENCSNSNNNHSGGEVECRAGDEGENDSPKVTLPSLQFIDDESEI